MAEESVGQLAETVGTPVERLLLQMEEAGLPQRVSDDVILEDEKEILLAFLKKSHGEDEGAPRKITLKRRTLSTLKTGGSAGRGRTVNVEVRKKRTYVRRGTPEVEEASEAEEAKLAEAPEVAGKDIDAEAERKRQEAAVELLAEQEEREQKAKEEEEKKRLSEEAAASSEKRKSQLLKKWLKKPVFPIEKTREIVTTLTKKKYKPRNPSRVAVSVVWKSWRVMICSKLIWRQ